MSIRFVSIAQASQIGEGQTKSIEVEGKSLLICRAAGDVYVVDNRCSHDNAPLEGGCLEGTEIECPRHGARFDVRTGGVLCLPAPVAIRSYPVRVEGDAIWVGLD